MNSYIVEGIVETPFKIEVTANDERHAEDLVKDSIRVEHNMLFDEGIDIHSVEEADETYR